MKEFLQQFLSPFRKPSPEEMAIRELEEARRSLLDAQSAKDYSIAICAYNTDRIGRLTKYIQGKS
jgi:hypothetical protein